MHYLSINLTVVNNSCWYRWEVGYINIEYKVKEKISKNKQKVML